jgi:hypothetical protein
MYNKFNVIMVREESTNVSCNNSYAVAVSQRVGEIVDRRKSDMAAVAENRVARVGICGLYPMGVGLALGFSCLAQVTVGPGGTWVELRLGRWGVCSRSVTVGVVHTGCGR